MLLALTLIVLWTGVHGGREATVDLRIDLTNVSVGVLTFMQDDEMAPVKVMGTLQSARLTGVHVS
jgi:hypothetical protein